MTIHEKFTQIRRAHKKCYLTLSHFDHNSGDDDWLAVFKVEENGASIEFREYGPDPDTAASRLYSKWSKLQQGIVPDVFLPALEAPETPTIRPMSHPINHDGYNRDLDDEVPF